MGDLAAYGHSWVAGEAASHESLGFVALSARRLGLTAINLGVGGSASTDTAEQLARRPPPAVELFVVMTGLNDARRYGVSPEALDAYTVAMQSIFETLGRASPGGRVIAIEQPHLLEYSRYPPHDRGSNQILDAYNKVLRAVARRHPMVGLAAVRGWDPRTMLDEDTVHPNDAGHAQLARAAMLSAEDPGAVRH